MRMRPSWQASVPGLDAISGTVSELLNRQAEYTSVRKGTVIFGPEQPAENLLLLISGTVRLQQPCETGGEIVLSRVHAGESCALTTACLLAFKDYSAEGIAETDVDAITIPRETFDELMMLSPQFRAYVFEAYSKRITDLFTGSDKANLQGKNACRLM